MTDNNSLLIRKENAICTLEINRPEKLNAFTTELYSKLIEALHTVNEDGQTRVVILRGSGEKAFSAGHDISQLPTSETTEDRDPLEGVISSIESCDVPVIAMIYGYCIGAAFGMGAACDMRLVADNAHLGVTAARLGLVYPASVLLRLINVIGVSATKELLYTGKLIDAERARQLRLADHVVPAAQLSAVTYDLAREIAANSPLSIRGTKKMIRSLLSYQNPSPEAKAEFLLMQEEAAASQDFKEGKLAFLEKRPPVFRGI